MRRFFTKTKPSTLVENGLFFGAVLAVLFALYFQANDIVWRRHLEVDTWVWYQKIKYFRAQGSLAGLVNNEYLPATLAYLFLPGLIVGLSTISYSQYLQAVLLINLIISSGLLVGYKMRVGLKQSWLFLGLLLLFGPIILFRFDNLVMLLILTSIWSWQKKQVYISAYLLGWATAMKVFPIVLLPYWLIILWRRKSYGQTGLYLLFYTAAILLPILGFLILGGKLSNVWMSLQFHTFKPVGIESMYGVILTGISLLRTGMPPDLIGSYGVWGIGTQLIDRLGLRFFNYLWLLPVSLVYVYLLRQKKFTNELLVGVIFWLSLVFVTMAKNLNPQYIFWFMALFPVLKVKRRGQRDYIRLFILLAIIAILTQLIYPLRYSQFVEQFFMHGKSVGIYYLQLLRNVFMLLLLGFSFKYIFVKQSIK